MPEEVSLMICLADRQIDFLMECGNTGSVELGTVRKEWFEYVLVLIFPFIVRYFFVVCIGSSKSVVSIISLSATFYMIDDILIFPEGFKFPFFDPG